MFIYLYYCVFSVLYILLSWCSSTYCLCVNVYNIYMVSSEYEDRPELFSLSLHKLLVGEGGIH